MNEFEEVLENQINEQPEPLKEMEKKELKREKKEKKKIDKEVEELKNANLELKEKVLRITAEMQNMRRRSELDLANAYKYEGMDLIEKLLPIIDHFERALSIKQEGAEKFLSGFKMVYDQLMEILENKEVKEIKALHEVFDPNIMNAVMTETNEEYENGVVLEVMQKGYMYHDKLIRPAMVKVNERNEE